MRRFLFCVLILLLLLLPASAALAQGADWFYVSPSGVDSGECVELSPCATVAYALERLQAQNAFGTGVIAVFPGTYNESPRLYDANVTLRGIGSPGEVVFAPTSAPNGGGGIIRAAGMGAKRITNLSVTDTSITTFPYPSGIKGVEVDGFPPIELSSLVVNMSRQGDAVMVNDTTLSTGVPPQIPDHILVNSLAITVTRGVGINYVTASAHTRPVITGNTIRLQPNGSRDLTGILLTGFPDGSEAIGNTITDDGLSLPPPAYTTRGIIIELTYLTSLNTRVEVNNNVIQAEYAVVTRDLSHHMVVNAYGNNITAAQYGFYPSPSPLALDIGNSVIQGSYLQNSTGIAMGSGELWIHNSRLKGSMTSVQTGDGTSLNLSNNFVCPISSQNGGIALRYNSDWFAACPSCEKTINRNWWGHNPPLTNSDLSPDVTKITDNDPFSLTLVGSPWPLEVGSVLTATFKTQSGVALVGEEVKIKSDSGSTNQPVTLTNSSGVVTATVTRIGTENFAARPWCGTWSFATSASMSGTYLPLILK